MYLREKALWSVKAGSACVDSDVSCISSANSENLQHKQEEKHFNTWKRT